MKGRCRYTFAELDEPVSGSCPCLVGRQVAYSRKSNIHFSFMKLKVSTHNFDIQIIGPNLLIDTQFVSKWSPSLWTKWWRYWKHIRTSNCGFLLECFLINFDKGIKLVFACDEEQMFVVQTSAKLKHESDSCLQWGYQLTRYILCSGNISCKPK